MKMSIDQDSTRALRIFMICFLALSLNAGGKEPSRSFLPLQAGHGMRASAAGGGAPMCTCCDLRLRGGKEMKDRKMKKGDRGEKSKRKESSPKTYENPVIQAKIDKKRSMRKPKGPETKSQARRRMKEEARKKMKLSNKKTNLRSLELNSSFPRIAGRNWTLKTGSNMSQALPRKSILTLFWDPFEQRNDICSPNIKTRQKAQARLVRILSDVCLESRNETSPKGSNSSSMELVESFPDLLYACERLVKGLTSPTQSSYEGFMEMLGKMLRHFNGSKKSLAIFQPSYLLSLVDKLLHPSEREKDPTVLATGRVRAVLVLCNCWDDCFKEDLNAIASKSLLEILQSVPLIGWNKPISLAALGTIDKILPSLDKKHFRKNLLPSICKGVSQLSTKIDLDVPLLLLIIALERHGLENDELKKQLKSLEGFGGGGILHAEKSIVAAAPILNQAKSADSSLHPIWEQVVRSIASEGREVEKGGDLTSTFSKRFSALWQHCVSQQTIGFKLQLLSLCWKVFPSERLPFIFPNSISCILEGSKGSAATVKLNKNLTQWMERKISVALPSDVCYHLASTMLKKNPNFDKKSRTQVTKSLLAGMNSTQLVGYIKLALASFSDSTKLQLSNKHVSSPQDVEEIRREMLEEALRAIAVLPSNVTSRAPTVNDFLFFLCRHSFFIGGSSKDWKQLLPSYMQGSCELTLLDLVGSLSKASRNLCVDRLFGLLISTRVNLPVRVSNSSQVSSGPLTTPSDVEEVCNKIVEGGSKKISLETALTEEQRRKRRKLTEFKSILLKVAEEEEKGKGKRKREEKKKEKREEKEKVSSPRVKLSSEVSQLLSFISLLQLKTPGELDELLSDLAGYLEDLWAHSSVKAGEEEEKMELLYCNLLTHLLSKESSILREVSISSMKNVASSCSHVSLRIMTWVLQSTALRGKLPFFRSLQELDEGGRQAEEGQGGKKGGEEEKEEEGESSDAMEIDVSRSTNESSIDFDALSPDQKLGEKSEEEKSERFSIPLSQAESEDLQYLDKTVTMALSSKRGEAGAGPNQLEWEHFRSRMVEMLKLWVLSHHSDHQQILETTAALLEVLYQCHSDPVMVKSGLRDKIFHLLISKDFFPSGTFTTSSDVSDTALIILNNTLQLLSRPSSSSLPAFREAATRAIFYTLRCIPPNSPAGSKALPLINASLTTFLFTRKLSLHADAFKYIFAHFPHLTRQLLPTVLAGIAGARSDFRKMDAAIMVEDVKLNEENPGGTAEAWEKAQRSLEELGRGAKRSTTKGKRMKRAIRIVSRLTQERRGLEKQTGR